MRLLLAALVLAGALDLASAATRSRAQANWGGPDFPFSCDTVRSWRAEIDAMSPATRAALARKFKITRKQRRQAYDCLRASKR